PAPTDYTVTVASSPSSSATVNYSSSHAQTAAVYRYTVQSGNTLSGIAAADGTTVAALAALNHLTNINHLEVGQTLLLPYPVSSGQRPATQRSSGSSAASAASSTPGPGVDGQVRRTARSGSGSASGPCADNPLLCQDTNLLYGN
ncbi:MAG: LysM peptidoglycan-binding domain-containing protein, partial [Sulfobacillus sp.]